jgi:RNA polymerase sigma factor (sigma-70 family)
MTTVIQHLRRAVLARDAAALSDGQLLDRFLARREDAAFAALVRRHGPMVFGVCLRLLADPHDAEDAFQATFLVLVKKADSIRPRERVGPWLHGVALRTASKARCRAARRRVVERRAVAVRAHEAPGDDALWRDLRPVLDAELGRLPEAYRAPVVLCDLEGASRGEAARRLGVPEGTISSRLARGRELLGRRLRRRGVALTAGLVALTLARQARAAVPHELVELTVNSALGGATAPIAALARGVIQAMFYSQCKLVATVAAVAGIVALALGVGAHRAQAEKPAPPAAATTTVAADKPDKPEAGPSLDGTVTSLDAKKNAVTLRVQEDPGKKETVERTYALATDAKVRLEHGLKKESKDGSLADVTEGAAVTVQLSPDKKSVLLISVHPGNLQGSVKSVDATKNAITITTKSKAGAEEKTVTLMQDAKVILDDGLGKKGDAPKEGKLSDVGEGLPVWVQLSGYDRTQAVGVRVSGPTISGTVKGVDVGNGTITVTVKEDGQVVDKPLPLSKEVKVDGAKLTDLSGGERVSLRLSVTDRKTVVGIHVAKE